MSGDATARLERFHAACGSLVRAAARLDAALVLYLKALLGVDEARARIVWHALASPAARRDCLERLGRAYLDEMPLKRLGRLLGEVDELGGKCRWIASAEGGLDGDTGAIALRVVPGSAPATSPSGFEIVSIGGIEVLAREVAGLEVELMGFLRALAGAVRAGPRL